MTADVELEIRESVARVMENVGLNPPAKQLWTQALELGWLLVLLPEDQGGLELGLNAALAIHGEIGRWLGPANILSTLLAGDAIAKADPSEAREKALADMAQGVSVGVPLGASELTAEMPRSSEIILSGTASAVPDAQEAAAFLVWNAERNVAALVPHAQVGLKVELWRSWDTTRSLSTLHLDECALASAQILASGDKAVMLVRRIETHRNLALAAEAACAADALLALTVEYLKDRRQFGRPLASFQALKHRCADLKAEIAAAKALLTGHVRLALSANENEAHAFSLQAKAMACATFSAMANEAMQLHGGIAMSDEHVCHLYLKRARLTQMLGEAPEREYRQVALAWLEAHAGGLGNNHERR